LRLEVSDVQDRRVRRRLAREGREVVGGVRDEPDALRRELPSREQARANGLAHGEHHCRAAQGVADHRAGEQAPRERGVR